MDDSITSTGTETDNIHTPSVQCMLEMQWKDSTLALYEVREACKRDGKCGETANVDLGVSWFDSVRDFEAHMEPQESYSCELRHLQVLLILM